MRTIQVSPECARAMARGAMECSGLLQKDRYKEFKYGQLVSVQPSPRNVLSTFLTPSVGEGGAWYRPEYDWLLGQPARRRARRTAGRSVDRMRLGWLSVQFSRDEADLVLQVFQGAQGSRVERLNVNDVRAHPPADNIRIDQEDANRNERKETVVARALEIALEVRLGRFKVAVAC